MNLKASSWASNRCVYTYITWLENFRLPYWLGECNIKTFLPALHNRANLSLSETIESTNFGYTIMGNDDSRGLLNTVLGFFARKRPERSAPAASSSQAREAWLRTEA